MNSISEVDVDGFEHHAFYNEGEGRIEMHLRAKSEQRIRIGGETFHFSEGETIHTENSYKYTVQEFGGLGGWGRFCRWCNLGPTRRTCSVSTS